MSEKVVETKTCKHCNSRFEITDKDLEFYKKVSPVFEGKKYQILTPTLCPDCRQQRRLVWRNERNLYKRKCDATGKQILSIYSPNKVHKVYENSIWYSDKWNALDFGKDFNFSKNFFEQFKELILEVPQVNKYLRNAINSEYTNGATDIKDCYLCFNSDHLEKCIYCTTVNSCDNSIDCSYVQDSDFCYDSVSLVNCYSLYFSNDSEDSSNCYFISSCKNCNDCFFCVNQVNKQYCIYNKQYFKEDYYEKIKEILGNNNIEKLKSEFYEYVSTFPKRYRFSKNAEDSIGNYINNVKESNFIYDCSEIEDMKYCWYVFNAKTCMDYDIYGDKSELIYESVMTGTQIYKSISCACNWSGSENNMYCNLIIGCKNCFGCIGLKNKSYCILNKQYTKEEYEKLVPKIIEHMQKSGEWGEFFPSSLSPFGYNETVAQEYFPLIKEEATKRGFNWSDYESPKPKVDKIIPANQLPENIKDIPDDILNWAIECEVTKKPFRIIKQELDFYRKHNLPIPHKNPDQRHLDRMKLRNPRKLYDRVCDCPDCEENAKNTGSFKKEDLALNKKTGKLARKIKTTYSPERPEIVYCENCYNKEIY